MVAVRQQHCEPRRLVVTNGVLGSETASLGGLSATRKLGFRRDDFRVVRDPGTIRRGLLVDCEEVTSKRSVPPSGPNH
jgi:hypothetical protein